MTTKNAKSILKLSLITSLAIATMTAGVYAHAVGTSVVNFQVFNGLPSITGGTAAIPVRVTFYWEAVYQGTSSATSGLVASSTKQVAAQSGISSSANWNTTGNDKDLPQSKTLGGDAGETHVMKMYQVGGTYPIRINNGTGNITTVTLTDGKEITCNGAPITMDATHLTGYVYVSMNPNWQTNQAAVKDPSGFFTCTIKNTVTSA